MPDVVYKNIQSKPAKRGTSGPEVGRPVLAERPVLRESFVWGLNQFLDHAPRFEGCPVFRVPRYAGFDCSRKLHIMFLYPASKMN